MNKVSITQTLMWNNASLFNTKTTLHNPKSVGMKIIYNDHLPHILNQITFINDIYFNCHK